MRFDSLKNLPDADFRRLTGVKPKTFQAMTELLAEARRKKKALGGRPNKLTVEDTLLMALEYWREYRTYFHIANGYGITESYAYKQIKWVEDILIKSELFSLPGSKALTQEDNNYDLILLDSSETPIERPKKK